VDPPRQRAAAFARDASRARGETTPQLTEDDLRALIAGPDDLRDVIRDAEPAVYEQLGLKITYALGGTIDVASPRGEGTTLLVTLPIEELTALRRAVEDPADAAV
jgi:hypothetical protein